MEKENQDKEIEQDHEIEEDDDIEEHLEIEGIEHELEPEPEELYLPDVVAFYSIIENAFKEFLLNSCKLHKDIREITFLTRKAFKVELDLLNTTLPYRTKPETVEQVGELIEPLIHSINNIQLFRNSRRDTMHFYHLSIISESVSALCWISVEPAPVQFVRDMRDSGQYYGNRVLKTDKSEEARKYINSWIQVLNDLEAYVKEYHTTGYSSWGKRIEIVSNIPPPPPPPPKVVQVVEEDQLPDSEIADPKREALLRDLNQGLDITKRLKKVEISKPKGSIPAEKLEKQVHAKIFPDRKKNPPKFALEGKKWCIEYQQDKKRLLLDNAELSQSVLVYKCENSVIYLKSKVNFITIDNCKRTSLVVNDIIAQVEIIHSEKIELQCEGKVPLISVDSSDDVQIFVKKDSMDVELFSSKSSSMNVSIIKPDGNVNEMPVPEQIKSVIQNGVLKSTVVEKM